MPSREVERNRLELKGPEVLSPPWLAPPYECAKVVQVFGFVPHATIDVDVDGVQASQGVGFPEPQGALVNVPGALVPGQLIKVRQSDPSTGRTSDWSAPTRVHAIREDFPAGPPRPELFPLPVHGCGTRVGVGNLLVGSNVGVEANGSQVGQVSGAANPQGVNVSPAFSNGQVVRAFTELCGNVAPPSAVATAVAAPLPLPAPTIDNVYETQQQLVVRGVVNGATITLSRNGAPIANSSCWGGSITMSGITAAANDEFSATQQLCPGDPSSDPGKTTTQPCSAIPAPKVGPVQAGDITITVTNYVPGGVIDIYVNLVNHGFGSGPVIVLDATLVAGDLVHVGQSIPKGCTGSTMTEVVVACVDGPVGTNPSARNLFPVGTLEYTKGDAHGSVYYPSEDDGPNQPFRSRLSALGRVPVVFMLHGNHSAGDPSFLGYDFFQQALAQQGFVAVSVDSNKFNFNGGDFSNIEDRADLLLQNVVAVQGLDADPNSPLHSAVDFSKCGFMGHSRGGEAVIIAAEHLPVGVTLQSVLSLAPTDFARWFSVRELEPKGYAYMTILPAGDGDVDANDGAKFYDKSHPGPFSSQLYVRHACHNFFNRQWALNDGAGTGPPIMTRSDHEAILAAYGCALFRATLQMQPDQVRFLTGEALPGGVVTSNVDRSFRWDRAVIVDDHEQPNGIGQNTMAQPTSQSGGLSADEFTLAQTEFPLPLAPGQFNGSFFGRTVGVVFKPGGPNREFRSALKAVTDLRRAEVWIRVAEVSDEVAFENSTGFRLGLEDNKGNVAWVSSDGVGGVPRPYLRSDRVKSMLSTLRFRAPCFTAANAKKINLRSIVAIRINADREDRRSLAFDDLHLLIPKS